MPLLRWTCKSTRQLAKAITEQGFKVGRQLVSEMFNELGFSLQGNVKVKDGKQSEDRDEQFQYLNRMIVQFQAEGQPESQLIRRRKSWSERIPTSRKARKSRRLRLRRTFGQSYSLRSLRRHRKCRMGKRRQQLRYCGLCSRNDLSMVGATKLLIAADGGGSNGSRVRLWKLELSKFAAEIGLEITVIHLPPGTSMWNKIEHRLFSYISMNWRGRPLTTHEVIVQLIASTTTKTGLKVVAESGRRDVGNSDTAPLLPRRLELYDFIGGKIANCLTYLRRIPKLTAGRVRRNTDINKRSPAWHRGVSLSKSMQGAARPAQNMTG